MILTFILNFTRDTVKSLDVNLVTGSGAMPVTQAPASPMPASPTNNSIVFKTPTSQLVYDIGQQSYWTVRNTSWERIHDVPTITIKKSEARKFLRVCDTWEKVVAQLATFFPGIQPAESRTLSHSILFFNALHDSIIVLRKKENSSLAQFKMDKLGVPPINSVPHLLPFLRPRFITGCACPRIQTFPTFLFCPNCATFRARQVKSGIVSYSTISIVGKLTFNKLVADSLAMYCADTQSGKFIIENTFSTLDAIFHLAAIRNIPATQEQIVRLILQHCLSVRQLSDNAVVSWAYHYKAKEFGLGDAISLLRLGLAIGTLGTLS
ncbi:ABC bile acid transporter [Purpureocillium lavendulum]|uniref:ABC bile acid transporter n=1 Tax=Purpureocillium lavendulum TaxID=1247861 RepID=A0AB34FX97_9HYPO|nr:ABC bile acid transporter [Purpureocillium lavendulum]